MLVLKNKRCSNRCLMNKTIRFLIILFMFGSSMLSFGSLFSMSEAKLFNCYEVKQRDQVPEFLVKLYCDTPLDKAVTADIYCAEDRLGESGEKCRCIHVGNVYGARQDFTLDSFVTYVESWRKPKQQALVFDDIESLINVEKEEFDFALFKEFCSFLPDVSRFFILKCDNEWFRNVVERVLLSHGICGTIICLTADPTFAYADVEAELRKKFCRFWRIRFGFGGKKEIAFVDENFIDY